ncbi:hypothetical protein Desru_0918 [Desulforamulus ruminis DSM 2154]|uniref:Uncharacterized protein n=1 Tax=Desulforamulus ruminis (strain ATCC 23193 / DSM 2154 / NCIMB 8452 / DL) TaxID=696281 RepID=F6DJY0_DESRL|nr:hypothetical protein Desru_0918 [Desulforamulus ruminis DSM 2154]
MLVALIDIYRGLPVTLPNELETEVQTRVLRDVLSSAISFARQEESMKMLSEELFRCSRESCTLAEQIQVIEKQSPDIINAKMVAAAYLLKLLNEKPPGKANDPRLQ